MTEASMIPRAENSHAVKTKTPFSKTLILKDHLTEANRLD